MIVFSRWWFESERLDVRGADVIARYSNNAPLPIASTRQNHANAFLVIFVGKSRTLRPDELVFRGSQSHGRKKYYHGRFHERSVEGNTAHLFQSSLGNNQIIGLSQA